MHRHKTDTGLRQRIEHAGILVLRCDMTGSEDRGAYGGHVPEYTVILVRDDGRTLAYKVSGGGEDAADPTPFDCVDTLMVGATAAEECNSPGAWVEYWDCGDPLEPSAEQVATYHAIKRQAADVRRFLEDEYSCWECWVYYTDRDPGRQGEYDEDDDDE